MYWLIIVGPLFVTVCLLLWAGRTIRYVQRDYCEMTDGFIRMQKYRDVAIRQRDAHAKIIEELRAEAFNARATIGRLEGNVKACAGKCIVDSTWTHELLCDVCVNPIMEGGIMVIGPWIEEVDGAEAYFKTYTFCLDCHGSQTSLADEG